MHSASIVRVKNTDLGACALCRQRHELQRQKWMNKMVLFNFNFRIIIFLIPVCHSKYISAISSTAQALKQRETMQIVFFVSLSRCFVKMSTGSTSLHSAVIVGIHFFKKVIKLVTPTSLHLTLDHEAVKKKRRKAFPGEYLVHVSSAHVRNEHRTWGERLDRLHAEEFTKANSANKKIRTFHVLLRFPSQGIN